MEITFSTGQLIVGASIVSAALVFKPILHDLVQWMTQGNKNREQISILRACHEKDIVEIKSEQALIILGLLGALKGLEEKGCNGPVKEARTLLEEHINRKAHDIQ